MKNFTIFALLCVITVSVRSAFAWETDNFLAWGVNLKDSTEILNDFYNGQIQEVLNKSNAGAGDTKKCEKLIPKLGLEILGGVWKNTHEFVLKNPEIDQVPSFGTPMKEYLRQSIYADSRQPKELSPVLNVNGIYIGADKLSHSLGMGFVLYLSFRKDFRNLSKKFGRERADAMAWEKAFEKSIRSEQGFTGLGTTEVFSYADTEANYQGARFYQSFCNGDSPRIQAKADATGKLRWELVRPLDLREYVNPWWDESVYPNYFTDRQGSHVKKREAAYCEKRNLPQVRAQQAYYATFASESENVKYLKQAILDGKSPDPKDYALDSICGR